MTAFNVAMLITADPSQARRGLKEAETEVQKFGAAARQAGNTAAAGFDKAEAEILQFRRAASGATGNLIAQFNDVGQMLIAGQSPLLLAAQQGTQISQALGPLGAAGAARALGAAFIGMLSPVNLAVFGAVAALGLLGNSLRGLVGETKSVGEAIGELADATKAWRETASVGIAELTQRFGAITPAIVEMQRQLTELALAEQFLKAADAAEVLSRKLNPGSFELTTRARKIADLLGTEAYTSGVFQFLTPEVEEFQSLLQTVGSSEGIDRQIAALDRMQAMILASAGGYREMTAAQREFFEQTVSLEQQLRLVQAAQDGIGSAQRVSEERLRSMIAGLEDERRIRELIRRYGEDSLQVEAARAEIERRGVQQMLAMSDASEELKRQFLEAWDAVNGVQVPVANLVAALLDGAGAGDNTRRAIEDAWAAITGAADGTNIWASAMAGVAAEVRGIGAALATLGAAGIANVSKEIEIAALRSGQSVAEARRTAMEAEIRREGEARLASARSIAEAAAVSAATETRLRGVELDRQLEAERRAAAERERLAARGSAGRGAARQTDAGQRLLAMLEREHQLLLATDPVQKEIIRNREALAQLMGEERLRAEELITANARLQEQQQLEKQGWEDIKQAAFDALDGLILRGESATEVIANLADWLARAFLQSAFLGTGPLAGLFGGQGTGLLDLAGQALGIPGAATGGLITGPGGPTDDAILARLSNGEFVVNAAATARHRPLLEAINGAPRFASGGIVGTSANSPFPPGGSVPAVVVELRLADDLDARIAEASQEVSVRVMRAGIEEYDRKVLPKKMRAVRADPRRVG